MVAERTGPLKVFLLTGGTGRTGEHVLNAALAQFHEQQVQIVRRLRVRSVGAAAKAVKDAALQGAVLCHTLVVPRIRQAVIEASEREQVPTVDILGPLLTVLQDQFEHPPLNRPGLSYELQKEHFDRIDAVDFTLAHDDGCRVGDLDEADVVLAGVSRVSKSVTCFYLACRGIRAANVPLVHGCDPPGPLANLDPEKVIGLTMNPRRLKGIRSARRERFPTAALDAYVDQREIAAELREANQLMSRYGWTCIDVSYRAVEEVAAEIVARIRS